ncbi:DUF1707 SHOCT-like domain-containing protein [Blastococcus xanthinilyticus]|uniref:Uncharacterized protein DUF1707 n=1 Tax=Blastococcus xanthinilyticus TaxID=1564164 RepID=A0A5S5CWB9_9ACTN|nr:DUF1707 domain-containing protein [Blastococcus xanthinilyticus]TYP88067.1 uncharacterized protein DUF1707 [Blastococcus xanthinilyticus]
MTQPVRPEDLRISDAERTSVAAALQRAHEAGQLDLNEFDQRVQAVWASRTRGDLARVTADLPALPPPPGPRRAFTGDDAGTAMKVLTTIWLCISLVNLVLWGILELTVGGIHPWWLYVALPPGAVLGTLYAIGVGRPGPGRS